MSLFKKVCLDRFLRNGRCLDVTIHHGVCNEPSFRSGLEEMEAVVDSLVAAGPDAIQMNQGQADHLQTRPAEGRLALVMRVDLGNPYNRTCDREMWALLLNEDEPLLPALRIDATCVVVDLFMLPDEPDLFRQCVCNISRIVNDCEKYGMPLMIEPRVMQPNEKDGYLVGGDIEKVVTLVRLAREQGTGVVKADPTNDPANFHHVVQAARCPVLVPGGRQGRPAPRHRGFGRTSRPGGPRHGLMPQYPPARRPRPGDGPDPRRRLGRGRLVPPLGKVGGITCLLGINAGNTGVKALLFDEEGRELARAQRETGGTSPAPGQVERDAARLRGDLFDLVAELLRASCRDGD